MQTARLLGARVVATAGSDAKCEKALWLGAEHVVNHEEQDFLAAVKALGSTWSSSTRAVDLGEALLELVKEGRLVTVGTTSGYDPRRASTTASTASFPSWLRPWGRRTSSSRCCGFGAEGRLRPVFDRAFPLVDAVHAQELLSRREQFGNVLVP